MRRLNRVPIRVRVALVFTSVMAVVLAGVALFLYLRLAAQLDATIEQSLRARAAALSALVRRTDSKFEQVVRSRLTEEDENLAQIVDSSGRVVEATPSLRARRVLSRVQLRRARRGAVWVTTSNGDNEARWLAVPARAQDDRVVVAVGTSLEDRDDAVDNLGGLLLIGGPVALVLAAVAGYGALTAALRPVESMRRRAAAVDHAAPGQRLPVPAAQDEIARLAETLNAMLARLEAAFARERTFVSDASHELRTPLAVLKAELELALRAGRSASDLEQGLRSAAEETDRLVQLAEDLLVIARSDQGRLPIRRGGVDVHHLLDGVLKRFARRARDQEIELELVTSPGVELVADDLRLEQALGNLVDNALRHADRRVEVVCELRGAAVELHVRDDGPGFPADFIDVAFERFTRADSARGRRGGTGLGLAIVAAIARAHGGCARARNLPRRGADVWIALPHGPEAGRQRQGCCS